MCTEHHGPQVGPQELRAEFAADPLCQVRRRRAGAMEVDDRLPALGQQPLQLADELVLPVPARLLLKQRRRPAQVGLNARIRLRHFEEKSRDPRIDAQSLREPMVARRVALQSYQLPPKHRQIRAEQHSLGVAEPSYSRATDAISWRLGWRRVRSSCR